MKAIAALLVPVLASTVVRVNSCSLAPPPVTPGPEPITFADGFEAGAGNWQPAADVPADPNNPGQTVAWNIAASPARAFRGQYSALFSLDGRQDDGTIWLERRFNLDPSTDYTVEITLVLWSESESFNTLARVVSYAGGAKAQREADFNVAEQPAANLSAGWRSYDFRYDTSSSTGGYLWVAFGISAVWETQLSYFIDEVQVRITPR